MIKKSKINFLALAVLTLTLAVAGWARAADLTFNNDTIVTVNGNDYVIKSGSEVTSMVVNPTTLVVVVPAAATFTLDSVSGFTLANDQGVTETCASSGVGSVAYSGAGTITITPSTVVMCLSGGSRGVVSSSAPSATPTVPPTPAPVSCPPGDIFSAMTGERCSSVVPAVVCSFGQAYSSATGQKCNIFMSASTYTPPSSVPSSLSYPLSYTAPSAPASNYAFGTVLVKMGTKGEACKAWQMFLNDKTGAGLAVDGWCGKLSIAAAKSWQASMGLVADGLLGKMSRAKAMTQ